MSDWERMNNMNNTSWFSSTIHEWNKCWQKTSYAKHEFGSQFVLLIELFGQTIQTSAYVTLNGRLVGWILQSLVCERLRCTWSILVYCIQKDHKVTTRSIWHIVSLDSFWSKQHNTQYRITSANSLGLVRIGINHASWPISLIRNIICWYLKRANMCW